MKTSAGDTVQNLLDYLERGQNRSATSQPSIFWIPGKRREQHPDSFRPWVVSIGPVHEDLYLPESSRLKTSHLHDLLHRLDSTREQTLKACVEKVDSSKDQIRASYSNEDYHYFKELAEKMVLDGCFILEFCYKHYENYQKCLPNKIQNVRFAIDLILFENQIPFFVLQDLFDCTIKKISQIPLTRILHNVLALYLHPFTNPLPELPSIITPDVDHILGLFHRCYKLPQMAESPSVGYDTEPPVHSVVELDRSGVNFKPHKDKDLPMTIEFKSSSFVCFPLCWGKPTLLLPQLVINKCSEPVLRNLIAYEQFVPQIHHNFTSYAYTMDKLVDTEDDVSKLVESKVLVNKLGSNEEAANVINGIYKNSLVVSDDYHYTQELSRLDDYCNRSWPKNMARLKRTYFSSPWNAIALFAGIILFSLTVVQTVFSIRQAN